MTVALNTGSNTDTSTTPAPDGHDEAMIAKAEGQTKPETTPTTEAQPERPAWLPEKFKSPEDMAKAYAELEKKQGSQSTEAKPDATAPAVTSEGDARATVEQAGLDFDALNDEYAKAGQLSDATYEKLAKAGINRTVADQYIAGQTALANQTRTEVFSVVGGEEQYGDMIAWAKDNLSPAEQNAYNKAMDSRDIAQMKLAVQGLNARYTAENGSAPKLVSGRSGSGAQASGDVFRSTAELTAAMKDPRYQNDPAYRKDVTDRLARSNIM